MPVTRATWFGRMDMLQGQLVRLGAANARAVEVAATGRRVSRPSDAPTEYARLQRVKAAAADQETWLDNAGLADGLLSTADQALDAVGDRLGRLRELVVQMSSETYTDDERAAAADEVRALKEDVVGLANTDFAGRYVFAGTAYDAEPFAADGTYAGSSDEPDVKVGEGIEVTTGFDGAAVFQGDIDVFGVFDDVADAMESGDADALAGLLDDVDTALDQVVATRARVGVQLGQVDDAVSLASSLQVEMARQASAVEDADMAEAAMDLSEASTAYSAALQVVAAARSTPLFSLL